MSEEPRSLNNHFAEKLAALEASVEKAKDQRFENYESRLSEQNKFFRNVLYIVGIVVVLTQGIVVLYQFNSVEQQKDDIQRMETALKDDIALQLGKSKPLPQLEVLAANGGILSN